MATTKAVDVNTLPTLDDFLEVKSDLSTSKEVDTKKADEEAKAKEEAAKVEALKKEADTKKAKETKDIDDIKKAEELKKKEAEEKDKAEKNKTKTTTTKVEPTAEQLDALVKKAEATPDTLTEDERKLLIEKGLFEEATSFWEDVEKEHGIKVEVDYGTVDPESAQGAALRDKALINLAAANQMTYIQDTYPEVYQILEHVANGGQVTDLINIEEPDFSKIKLEKDDKEGQKELLLNFYMQKGFDEKKSQRMVDADEESAEGLLVAAQDALKQLTETQQEQRKAIIENQKAIKAEIEKRDTAFRQAVKQLTDNGKLGDFTIMNKKDKDDFYDFAVNRIYSNGKSGYQVVLPIDDKTIVPVLQQLFFSFKNGNLSEFVKREAQTTTARKLLKKTSQAAVRTGVTDDEALKKATSSKSLPTFEGYTVE